jgi:hypothetical protein
MWGRRLPGASETYEILALRNGHWQIAMVMASERDRQGRSAGGAALDVFEEKVRGMAAAQLGISGTRSVKVVRERVRPDGSLAVSELLCLDGALPGARIIGLAPIRDAGPRCETAGDLLQRPACQLIGTLLRGLLDTLRASPLELLTDEAWSRSLQPHEALIASAIRKVASLQASGDPHARAQTLERLVGEMQRRARAAAARLPCLPDLDRGGLDVLMARIRALGSADGEFLILRALARHLRCADTGPLKAGLLLDLLVPGLSAPGVSLVDRFVAGLVDAPSLIEALFGSSDDPGTDLMALADFAAGGVPDEERGLARRLAVPLAAGLLPDTHDALWDRVVGGLLCSRPLAAHPREEWSVLNRLDRDFQPKVPEGRRARFAAAIAARRLALHRAAEVG